MHLTSAVAVLVILVAACGGPPQPLPQPSTSPAVASPVAATSAASRVEHPDTEVVATGVPIELAPHRPGEQQDSFLSVEKAQQALGWALKVTLEEGLAKTFAWFEKKTAGVPV